MSDVVGRAELEISVRIAGDIQRQFDNIARQADSALTKGIGGSFKKLEGNLNEFSNRSQSTFQNVNRQASQAGQSINTGFGNALKNVSGKALDGIGRAFEGIGRAASAAFGTVEATARVAGVALSVLGVRALDAGIEFNKLQQQVRGALTAILGGQTGIEDTEQRLVAATAATNDLLAAVNALNDESPFSRQSFLQLTQTLAGFGVEAEKIPPVLDAIQQSVAATGGGEAELLGLGQAFARIASSGRITGDIIQTFASRGIDLLQVLAREANRTGSAISEFAGKSGAEIREAISEGAIGARESIEALSRALSTDFAGATAAVRKNFGGALDTFSSRLRNIGADFTKAFIDPVQGGAAVDALNNISDALTVLRTALQPIVGPLLQRLADLLRFITAGIRDFAAQFGKASASFKQFTDGSNTASNALQGLFDKIKGFLPLLAFFGAKFGGTFLTQIPVVGQFLAGLNPVVLAIGALIAVTPQLRTAFADVAKTLTPLVKNLIPLFSNLLVQIGAALGPVISAVVSALVPAFVAFAGALQQIVPRLGPLVAAIGELLIKITPLVSIVANGLVGAFNALVPIVEKVITLITNLVTAISNVDFTAILGAVASGVGDAVGAVAEKATEGTASIAELNATVSGLVTTASGLAQAFLTLNFSGVISGISDLLSGLGTLEDQLGALGPVFTVIATAVAALAAAFVVLNIAQTALAVKTAVLSAVQAAQLATQISLTAGTNILTASVQGLAASMGLVIGPVAATVALVAAVAAAFVILYLRVQPVRDAVDSLVDAVLGFLPTMDQLKAAFDAIKPTLEAIGNVLEVVIGVALAVVIGYIQLMIPVVQALAGLVGGVLLTAWRALGPIIQAVGNIFKALLPIFSVIRENLALFAPLLLPLIPVFVALAATIGTVIVVLKLLPPLINLISSIINGVLKAAIDLIVDALNGLADIIGFVVGSINRFLDVLRFIGGIVVNVAQFLFGLRDAVGSVVNAFLNFGPIRAIVEQVTGAVGNLVGAIRNFGPIKAIIDGIGSAFEAAGRIIDGIISKMGKVRGLLNKLSFGKLFKDAGDEAEKAGKKTEILPQELSKIADAAAKAAPPLRTLQQIQNDLSAASDRLKTSLEGASKRIDPLFGAAEGLKSAQAGVTSAQQAASEATRRVTDLEKERAKILRDTISPAKEIAQAERDLTRARFALANTDREIIETQKELDRLRGVETAEQEAANERDIERAKIAANQARRAEAELLAAVNAEKEKGNEESAVEINLAGLTLDQARAKLAAARATLAAQQQGKQVNKDDTKQAKTQEEIEEEKKLARFDVLDAEQRIRDTERNATQFKLDTAAAIEENERKLIELNFQKTEQQDAINAKQTQLNDLRAGETTLAKEIKKIDEQIAAAKRAQADAARRVTDAIKAARDAEIALNIESAKFTGNLQRQAELELQRFNLRSQGLKLEPAVRAELEKTLGGIQNEINKVKELNGEYQRRQQLATAAVNLQTQGLQSLQQGGTDTLLLTQAIQKLTEVIGEEAAAKQAAFLAKVTGKPVATVFAEGGVAQHVNSLSGLVNRPTHVTVGEGYKHELVLPLTKPNRIRHLVAQHLPKYPGAMMAVKNALAPAVSNISNIQSSQSKSLVTSVSHVTQSPVFVSSPQISSPKVSAVPVVRKGEGPMTEKQADRMIELLESLGDGGTTINVEAPITPGQQYNEEMLAREIERQIRKIIGRLR